MPEKYEAIRDKFLAAGLDKKTAEKRAAMIFNAERPKGATPMGPNYEARKGKRK